MSQGFTVDRHVPLAVALGGLVQGSGMAAEHRLNRGGVELPQDASDRRVGRRFPPRQAERLAQLGEVNIDEAVDRAVGVGARDDRQNRQQQDVRQSIQFALGASRVLDFGQQADKRRERRHGNPVRGCGGCPAQSQTDPRRRNPYAAITGRFAPACGTSDSPRPQTAEKGSVEQPWPEGDREPREDRSRCGVEQRRTRR